MNRPFYPPAANPRAAQTAASPSASAPARPIGQPVEAGLSTFADGFERNAFYADIGNRAAKIACRLLPVPGDVPHGFHQTAMFIESCQMRAAQSRLRKAIGERLLAKELEKRGGWALAESAAIRETAAKHHPRIDLGRLGK